MTANRIFLREFFKQADNMIVSIKMGLAEVLLHTITPEHEYLASELGNVGKDVPWIWRHS